MDITKKYFIYTSNPQEHRIALEYLMGKGCRFENGRGPDLLPIGDFNEDTGILVNQDGWDPEDRGILTHGQITSWAAGHEELTFEDIEKDMNNLCVEVKRPRIEIKVLNDEAIYIQCGKEHYLLGWYIDADGDYTVTCDGVIGTDSFSGSLAPECSDWRKVAFDLLPSHVKNQLPKVEFV